MKKVLWSGFIPGKSVAISTEGRLEWVDAPSGRVWGEKIFPVNSRDILEADEASRVLNRRITVRPRYPRGPKMAEAEYHRLAMASYLGGKWVEGQWETKFKPATERAVVVKLNHGNGLVSATLWREQSGGSQLLSHSSSALRTAIRAAGCPEAILQKCLRVSRRILAECKKRDAAEKAARVKYLSQKFGK